MRLKNAQSTNLYISNKSISSAPTHKITKTMIAYIMISFNGLFFSNSAQLDKFIKLLQFRLVETLRIIYITSYTDVHIYLD